MMLESQSVRWAALFLVSCCAPLCAQLPDLDAASCAAYQTAIEPSSEEVAFLKVPWESELKRAIRRATREAKPLLIYVMNGHPLACT